MHPSIPQLQRMVKTGIALATTLTLLGGVFFFVHIAFGQQVSFFASLLGQGVSGEQLIGIRVSAPHDVKRNEPFTLEAQITNSGSIDEINVPIALSLPYGFATEEMQTKRVPFLKKEDTVSVIWQLRYVGCDVGINKQIQVNVLQGNDLVSSTTTIVGHTVNDSEWGYDTCWRYKTVIIIKEPDVSSRDHWPVAFALEHQGYSSDGKDVRVIDLELKKEIPSQTFANSESSILLHDNEIVDVLWQVEHIEKGQEKKYAIFWGNPLALVNTYENQTHLKVEKYDDIVNGFKAPTITVNNGVFETKHEAHIGPGISQWRYLPTNTEFVKDADRGWGSSLGTPEYTVDKAGADYEAFSCSSNTSGYDYYGINYCGYDFQVVEHGPIRTVISFKASKIHYGDYNYKPTLTAPLDQTLYVTYYADSNRVDMDFNVRNEDRLLLYNTRYEPTYEQDDTKDLTYYDTEKKKFITHEYPSKLPQRQASFHDYEPWVMSYTPNAIGIVDIDLKDNAEGVQMGGSGNWHIPAFYRSNTAPISARTIVLPLADEQHARDAYRMSVNDVEVLPSKTEEYTAVQNSDTTPGLTIQQIRKTASEHDSGYQIDVAGVVTSLSGFLSNSPALSNAAIVIEKKNERGVFEKTIDEIVSLKDDRVLQEGNSFSAVRSILSGTIPISFTLPKRLLLGDYRLTVRIPYATNSISSRTLFKVRY